MSIRRLYDVLPGQARARLKRLLGASGHGQSWLDRLKASQSARERKRLDTAAEELAGRYRQAGLHKVEGKACLEFGAGYVPTEALILHLLGARRVVATDYNAIAQFDQLYRAAALADADRVLNALAPLGDVTATSRRLKSLLDLGPAAGAEFLRRQIHYVAPHDMAQAPIDGSFDLINSVSVLEHIPPAHIGPIISNLLASLAPGGVMAHVIDLRDHIDLTSAPFGFLAADTDYDPERDCDARGNRLRKSDWLSVLSAAGADADCLWADRYEGRLPDRLAAAFETQDRSELELAVIMLVSRA